MTDVSQHLVDSRRKAGRDRAPAEHVALPVDVPAGRVWVKRAGRSSSRIWRWLHLTAARALGLELFRPPAHAPATRRTADEAARLQALGERGWPVPVVYAVHRDYLVLSDNGVSVHDVLPDLDADARLDLLTRALDFVIGLHARGGWHGGCQVRNLTLMDGEFGVIDFEDDLEGSMSLAAAQARDIVMFLMSSARHVEGDPVPALTILTRRALKRSAAPVREQLEAFTSRTSAFRPLARLASDRLGRDGRDLSALILALDCDTA